MYNPSRVNYSTLRILSSAKFPRSTGGAGAVTGGALDIVEGISVRLAILKNVAGILARVVKAIIRICL